MSEEKDGQEKQEQVEVKGRKEGNSKTVIIIAVALILIMGVVIAVMASKLHKSNQTVEALSQEQEKDEDEDESKRPVILAETKEEAAEQMKEWIQDVPAANIPRNYTVTQSANWEFPDGSSPTTNGYVENDPENETPVYFEIFVDATGELVYSSPVLELGATLENIKLDVDLDAGAYPCTMIYHLVDDKQNTLTTVNIGLNLIVLN